MFKRILFARTVNAPNAQRYQEHGKGDYIITPQLHVCVYVCVCIQCVYVCGYGTWVCMCVYV